MVCPDLAVLAALAEGGVSPEAVEHLRSCPACWEEVETLRGELADPAPSPEDPRSRALWASLAQGASVRPPRILPWAIAASLLVAVGLWLHHRSNAPGRLDGAGLQAAGVRSPAPAAALAGEAGREILVGASGEISLAQGARGRWLGKVFQIEQGRAWVESAGDLVSVSFPGGEGVLRVEDGLVEVQVGSPDVRVSLLLSEAWAGEPGASVRVVRGRAEWVSASGRKLLTEGQSWGSCAPCKEGEDRNWEAAPGLPARWHEGTLTLLPAGHPLPRVMEVLLRKRDRTAEGALLFSAGGRVWRVPLGSHLPAGDGWIRLRMESGGGRVRLLVGGSPFFDVSESGLAAVAYPDPGEAVWALKAWGGDLEAREARWRL